jgi:hypothetical protein
MIETLVTLLGGVGSLFGGTAFRLVIGRVMDFWEAKTNQKREIEFLEAQDRLAARAEERKAAAEIRLKELGITEIPVRSESLINEIEAQGWLAATKSVSEAVSNLDKLPKSGIKLVDALPVIISAWNASIRPALATIAIWLWVQALSANSYSMDEWDRNLVAAILGIFIGERIRQNEIKGKS